MFPQRFNSRGAVDQINSLRSNANVTNSARPRFAAGCCCRRGRRQTLRGSELRGSELLDRG